MNKKLMVAAMSFCVLGNAIMAADTVELDKLQSQPAQELYDEQVQETAHQIQPAESAPETINSPNVSNTRNIHEHSIALGVGQIFILGGLEKYGKNQMVVDLFYEYSASYSFDLIVNAHWSSHELESKKLWLRGYSIGIKSRVYNFDSFSPYVMGGLGIYNPQIKTNTGQESESKYTFGVHGGAGADLKLNNNFAIGFLGHLHLPFKKENENTPDVKGSYFKLLLLGKYTFR